VELVAAIGARVGACRVEEFKTTRKEIQCVNGGR
jgi:hypothetical protein